MKRKNLIFFFLFALLLVSCKPESATPSTTTKVDPIQKEPSNELNVHFFQAHIHDLKIESLENPASFISIDLSDFDTVEEMQTSFITFEKTEFEEGVFLDEMVRDYYEYFAKGQQFKKVEYAGNNGILEVFSTTYSDVSAKEEHLCFPDSGCGKPIANNLGIAGTDLGDSVLRFNDRYSSLSTDPAIVATGQKTFTGTTLNCFVEDHSSKPYLKKALSLLCFDNNGFLRISGIAPNRNDPSSNMITVHAGFEKGSVALSDVER